MFLAQVIQNGAFAGLARPPQKNDFLAGRMISASNWGRIFLGFIVFFNYIKNI